jgi:hypothetical protein
MPARWVVSVAGGLAGLALLGVLIGVLVLWLAGRGEPPHRSD